jgi:predicted PurR-regulated permease PerM
METMWRIFAGIGAGAVLFALTFVTLLIGGLVNGMVVLFAEKPINRFLEKRGLKH